MTHVRRVLLFAVALVATPALAQVALHESEAVGVYLARSGDGTVRVVGRPHASMPLAAAVPADTSEGRTRWASARKGAGTGALIGGAAGVVLIGVAAYADLTATDEVFFPWTFLAVPVALGVVGASTLIGGGIGYATGGE